MIEIITAAGFALAWFAFRYDRHQRWANQLASAGGLLRAVYHGMVEAQDERAIGGWGHFYFGKIYSPEVAAHRARETRHKVASRMLDFVLVVPTEPLARLATTAPHPHLIDARPVTVANIALWRVRAFNQLVEALGAFLTSHAAEITSASSDPRRRADLADAAMSLSLFVHQDGIGYAAAEFNDGSVGWYRALVAAVHANLRTLEAEEQNRWRWLREWPYIVLDAVALAAVIAVSASVVAGHAF